MLSEQKQKSTDKNSASKEVPKSQPLRSFIRTTAAGVAHLQIPTSATFHGQPHSIFRETIPHPRWNSVTSRPQQGGRFLHLSRAWFGVLWVRVATRSEVPEAGGTQRERVPSQLSSAAQAPSPETQLRLTWRGKHVCTEQWNHL